ncbi:uncharacterized protein LOC118423666 [Branchiostoma floridae]|uniref:Uncharacterized protein LOC118423666 n=1 Tax=Branchiostoma floridae TaxID=7739 RepID=C3Y0M5_BRAFL|nr:uncharacterized protein LOC118423666 [Branchiostoma floridae]|eukprot:XP_002610288.1 hypothetical protein BRAFLDRAFT_93012 [Branchiostoma floridae]
MNICCCLLTADLPPVWYRGLYINTLSFFGIMGSRSASCLVMSTSFHKVTFSQEMNTGRRLEFEDVEFVLEPSPCVCASPGSSAMCGWYEEGGKLRRRLSPRRKSSIVPRRRSVAHTHGGRQVLPPGSKPFVHHQDTHKYIEEYRASRQRSAMPMELVRITTPTVGKKPRAVEVQRTPRSREKRTQFLPPNIVTFQVFSEDPMPSTPPSPRSHSQHNTISITKVKQKTESFPKRNLPKGGERLAATPSHRSQTAKDSGRHSTQSEPPSDVICPPRWRPQYQTFKDMHSRPSCKKVPH